MLISRGELIEIGGSFRIPDIMERSGARLREVGHHQPHPSGRLSAGAGSPTSAAILTVHRSNFEQRGLRGLARAGRRSRRWRARPGVPVSVRRRQRTRWRISSPGGSAVEPRVADALAAGRRPRAASAATSCSAGRRRDASSAAARLLARCRRQPARARGPGRQDDARGARGHPRALSTIPDRPLLRDSGAPHADARRRRSLPRRAERLAAALSRRARALRSSRASPRSAAARFPAAVLPTTLVTLDAGALGPDGLALRLRWASPRW